MIKFSSKVPVIEKREERAISRVVSITFQSYMKNCEPFVFLPRLAMDNRNGLSWVNVNASSGTN